MSTPAFADSSLLLIALAAIMAVLAAHVALGWLHEAQRSVGLWLPRGIALVTAALALGSGLCAASVLMLAGEALSFQIGFRTSVALLLYAAAVGGSALIGAVLLSSVRWWSVTIAGAALGGLTLALHVGWVQAAGFRPGVTWEPVYLIAAGALLVVGCSSALWLNWSDRPDSQGRRRGKWRLGAAVLIGLSIATGMALLDSGLALAAQVGSVYLRQLPSGMLNLLAGVLLPLVLSAMAVDLTMRRRQRRHSRRQSLGAAPPYKGRRRRHKIPTL